MLRMPNTMIINNTVASITPLDTYVYLYVFYFVLFYWLKDPVNAIYQCFKMLLGQDLPQNRFIIEHC